MSPTCVDLKSLDNQILVQVYSKNLGQRSRKIDRRTGFSQLETSLVLWHGEKSWKLVIIGGSNVPLTGVGRLLYGSLSAVQCLLWLLYGAVWIDKHRVTIIEHRRPSCLDLTVTDLELRLHNTVSNPHSRIE